MTHLPLALGILVVLTWTYLIFGRGWFWRVSISLPNELSRVVRIAAIVPARNEAAVITRSVQSLLTQRSVEVKVFVINDHSSDDTAALAQSVSPEVTVIQGTTLPDGWSGKLWAVHQGINAAQTTAPDFFLLTDADIEHAPENVSRLAAIMEDGCYDLGSYMVRLHCRNFPERLLIPAFVFFFLKLYPPKWIANPQATTAGAAGGCMLIRPEALARAGGIEAVRDQIIDDCALARAVKSSGGRVWLGLTDFAKSVRPYDSFREIGSMISRTAFNQLDHSPLLLVVAIIGLLLTYISPIALLLFAQSIPAMTCAAIAMGLMTIAYAPMVRFYGLNPFWTLTLPLAALFYGGATLHSAVQFWRGLGGQWKGRSQDRLDATHA